MRLKEENIKLLEKYNFLLKESPLKDPTKASISIFFRKESETPLLERREGS